MILFYPFFAKSLVFYRTKNDQFFLVFFMKKTKKQLIVFSSVEELRFFHFGREQSIHGLRSTHFFFQTEILLQRRITFRLNGLTQKECYYFCLHRSANIKVELCKSIMCRREQPKMMRSINNTLENENFKLHQNEERFMNNMLLLIQKTSSAICSKIKA